MALDQLTWVFTALAVLGIIPFMQSSSSRFLRSSALVWIGVSGLFVLAGLVSPLEIRYALQTLPLLALFAGLYVSQAFRRRGVGRELMSAVFLSEEWVAELAARGAELPAEAEASMVIQHEIAGAPDGSTVLVAFRIWR